MLTINPSFSEWEKIFKDPGLCKAVVDRVTFRAHIIETGSESMRLATRLRRRKGALREWQQ